MSILKFKKTAGTLSGIFFSLAIFAQQQPDAKQVHEHNSIISNGLFIVMLCIIILLLLVIIGMAEVVKAGAMKQLLKSKAEKNKPDNKQKIVSAFILLLTAGSLFAQDAPPENIQHVPFTYWGMGEGVFYLMLCIIFFEIIFIYLLYKTGMMLLDNDEMKARLYGERRSKKITESKLMLSLTDAVPIEEESAILMDHDYDGIRELDNNLPPWWKYGFYVTIIVAVIYLLNFHVFHTGKLSHEEYDQQVKEGNEQVAEYKKTHRNMVDENNVGLLTDGESLDIGKGIFMTNCIPCHGQFGEGKEGLGPNFTDDYWLHGGSIQSVFRSIKYGWTDKGMKSWQQDLKPVEIQMVASYVKSLRGSNPPNPKEKQGELYLDEGAKPLDGSSVPVADSAKPATITESIKK